MRENSHLFIERLDSQDWIETSAQEVRLDRGKSTFRPYKSLCEEQRERKREREREGKLISHDSISRSETRSVAFLADRIFPGGRQARAKVSTRTNTPGTSPRRKEKDLGCESRVRLERQRGDGYGSIISTYNRNVHVRFVSHSRRNFFPFFFFSPSRLFSLSIRLSVWLAVCRWRDAAFTDEKRIREFVVPALIARQKEFVRNWRDRVGRRWSDCSKVNRFENLSVRVCERFEDV